MRARIKLFAVAALMAGASVFAFASKRAPSEREATTASAAVRPSASSRARAHRATADDESRIRAVLTEQVAAWNRGDVDAFMNGYWRSDKTLFVGANGVTRGWLHVLDRYHRNYPDRAAMGHLSFSHLEIQQDCRDAAVVIGEYHLQREKDHPSGIFTLNFRKFPEGWRIVVDHTTAFAPAAAARQHP
jgi:ketosteroid isomerase-like protein